MKIKSQITTNTSIIKATINLQFDGSDLPQGDYQLQLEIENQIIAIGNLLIQI